jgi:hypothetical protein
MAEIIARRSAACQAVLPAFEFERAPTRLRNVAQASG